MFTDVQKMFDPQAATKMMQNFFDASQFTTAGKNNAETVKKISGVCADTVSSCITQQTSMAQSMMEDGIECLRQLSTATSLEDLMNKQATWTKRYTETCQQNATQLAKTTQEGYAKCTDLITKAVSETLDTSKNFVAKATNTTTGKNS